MNAVLWCCILVVLQAVCALFEFLSIVPSSIVIDSLLCLLYSNVRVDTALNKFIWSMGIRNVAKRVRVRLERRRDEDEEASEKVCPLFYYTM